MTKKKLLLASGYLLLVAFLAGCLPQPGEEPWLKQPRFGEGGTVCLDENTAKNGLGRTLTAINRPTDDNLYPSPLLDVCENGDCPIYEGGATTADYLLVAENVKVEQVIIPVRRPEFPPRSDRQLAKQTDFSEPDRLYRPFCGDWCMLGLAYRGSFYCDFVFYLKSNNQSGGPLLGNQYDSQMPPNDSLFDVYFRKGAAIPEKLKCKQNQGQEVQVQQEIPQQFINFADSRWVFQGEGGVKAKDIQKAKPQGVRELFGTITDPLNWQGEFEVFKNLIFDSGEEIIYLVERGKVAEAEQIATTQPYLLVPYKEFQKTTEVRPWGKTLQLGTFAPPLAVGWIKEWMKESKPAIYLYPEKPTQLRVKLNPAGKLTVSDPPYDPENGWEVLALPDGTLKVQSSTHSTGSGLMLSKVEASKFKVQSYPYLFYEANLEKVRIEPLGFVIEGKKLVQFFKETLPKLGLNERETQDFIDYWMSRLDKNQPYYFIHFLDNEQIESLEPLTIQQFNHVAIQPDANIRLRAYFKPFDQPIKVEPQVLPIPPDRQGFTLVEWGGILDE